VSIFEGSPAEQAGLQPTDQIVRVEGKDITELTQEEGIALVRGPAGTPVRLGILRVGEADILKFEVLRGKIVVPSIETKVLEGNIGYVRLSQFEFSTAPDLRVALQNIDANNLDGLIIDVRGNPGGYLTTVIDVASAFIPDGNIVLERTPNNETEHPALGNAIAADVPMVILVDQGSASASELLAGALQDHHRATVVGMQTFGKGSVQSWFELTNGGGVRITISRWYTPDGHSVSEVGIQPDVVVEYVPDENADNQLEAAIQVLQGTYQPIVNQPSPR
jgi:carboxyl-terminal processing protease